MSRARDRDRRTDRSGGGTDRSGPRRDGPGREAGSGRSAAEWITFAVSCAIVLALAGFLLFQAVSGDREPARIELHPEWDRIEQTGAQHYLPIEIRNAGQRTAADVELTLSLGTGGGDRETATLRIPFLAGGAREEAVVGFRTRPAEDTLRVDGLSFLRP